MKISIQCIGLTARQDLTDLIEEKLGKLEKLSDRITDVKVILRVEKAENRENKLIEVILGLPGNDIFVKKHGASFEEIVHKASDTLERELKEWKAKRE